MREIAISLSPWQTKNAQHTHTQVQKVDLRESWCCSLMFVPNNIGEFPLMNEEKKFHDVASNSFICIPCGSLRLSCINTHVCYNNHIRGVARSLSVRRAFIHWRGVTFQSQLIAWIIDILLFPWSIQNDIIHSSDHGFSAFEASGHSGARFSYNQNWILPCQTFRSLAISAVLAFHLRPDLFPLGYLGVDMWVLGRASEWGQVLILRALTMKMRIEEGILTSTFF